MNSKAKTRLQKHGFRLGRRRLFPFTERKCRWQFSPPPNLQSERSLFVGERKSAYMRPRFIKKSEHDTRQSKMQKICNYALLCASKRTIYE